MSIQLIAYRNGALLGEVQCDDAVEVGRRDLSEPCRTIPYMVDSGASVARWIIAELEMTKVPRKAFSVKVLEGNSVEVTNINPSNNELFLVDICQLRANQSRVVDLPVSVRLPDGMLVRIQSPGSTKMTTGDTWSASMNSIYLGTIKRSESGYLQKEVENTLTRFSSVPHGQLSTIDVPTVLGWIEQAIAALQYPVDSPNYFCGIAKAVANIIDLDRAEIVLWNGSEWEFSASRRYVKESAIAECSAPSESLLLQALQTKRLVIYPAEQSDSDNFGGSVMYLHSAIACPILDVLGTDKEILGVLYADRRQSQAQRPMTLLEPEQKLVAIISTAVASSIARLKREQLVTKYQQFFSPKITEAIRQRPSLLDGEDAEVSVLFCDVRGFSKAADCLGAKAAMSWISDTLSELSAIVLESDGVLVDYVGDEMFAMWGAPDKTAGHSFRAGLAASKMMSLRAVLQQRYKGLLPAPVDFGIGICTGPARVGNTGSKQKFKYGPIGRTVNLGSRIQGLTKQWGVSVLMDASTAACIPSDIPTRRLCTAQVVGLDGEIELYELMDSDIESVFELRDQYRMALDHFEAGRFHEAVRSFAEIIQRFPSDGPSLLLLERAVSQLVQPAFPFSSVWVAPTK